MDFSLTESQTTVHSLAAELLRDHCTPEALRAVEHSDSPGFDRSLWAKLAEAGLLGTSIPEEYGGLGLGLVELAFLVEAAGHFAAPVPVLAGLGLGAATLVRHGSKDQQSAVLPGVVAGTTLVTAALTEPLGDELTPSTTATADGVLEGVKICVPAGLYADLVLVSASSADGPRLFLVDPSSTGVTVERQDTITYAPEALLVLEGARGSLVGDSTTVTDVVQVGQALASAQLFGHAEAATKLTAEYTKTREQFGHPIAQFQAVGQRAADCFIDTTTIKLTALQAIWLLDEGRPADKEVAVAKYFASEAGQRVVRAAAHLHGGMGVSREYPLHRHYLGAKQLELTLGSGTRQLARLGRLLADEPI
ncbi:MAG: acyl-CoA/acyl-ACP dehydrogenase [Actinomycetota bacterium]|nr:acyl-CoA/acyl-ACP dehydrogenase [Actinomycetota bacterium]